MKCFMVALQHPNSGSFLVILEKQISAHHDFHNKGQVPRANFTGEFKFSKLSSFPYYSPAFSLSGEVKPEMELLNHNITMSLAETNQA